MRNLIWIIFVLAAHSAGCSAQYPASPTPTPTLAALQLHYQNSHEAVSPGNSVSFALWAIDSEGAYELVNSRASWFSSNTAIATVTNGSARAVANGSADIAATYQGLTATARINVRTAQSFPLLQIGSFAVPNVGQTNRIFVRYFQTAASSPRDVSLEATYTSSNPEVFTVEAAAVTSRAPGTAIMTVSYSGQTASSYGSVPPMRTLP